MKKYYLLFLLLVLINSTFGKKPNLYKTLSLNVSLVNTGIGFLHFYRDGVYHYNTINQHPFSFPITLEYRMNKNYSFKTGFGFGRFLNEYSYKNKAINIHYSTLRLQFFKKGNKGPRIDFLYNHGLIDAHEAKWLIRENGNSYDITTRSSGRIYNLRFSYAIGISRKKDR